jgi:hypothetical protein
MKKLLSLALLFLITSPVYSRILLISDVDDTIKVSFVLDPNSVIANVPMVSNVFMGMPELYHDIAKVPSLSAIKYLSNAPRGAVANLHKRFLRLNNFPQGDLIPRRLRDTTTGNNHKLISIRGFIRQYHPQALLLIGDNGEADAEIYAIIRKEFPQIPALTFIRLAYSSYGFSNNYGKPLYQGQAGFVSSVDIATSLYHQGVFSMETLSQHVLKVVPAILKEGYRVERGQAMAFPEWYDCRDFSLPQMPILADLKAHELLQKYVEKVQFRCNREPYGD